MNEPHKHPKTVDWPPQDTDWSGSDEDTLAPGDDASGDSGQLSKIGRYRVIKTIGQGGFGRVYLAHDDELDRPVAIKVPRRDRLTDVADVEEYLTEARTLASLDHASIVPVYDVGRTDDGLCFVVSKYVEGSDLAVRIEDNRPSHSETAEYVATVAEALHYAHTQGLVHRDIKPANILLDTQGRPYVADFGLALKEADFGKGTGFAGTPAYMSPEQARGEGHRVDGRSDIFSLGVVFYELLTGKRPFHGGSIREVLDHISSVEARPPRQIVDRIPRELERICLKALSKRATDRYTTAQDMADDLRHFLKKTVADTTAPQLQPTAASSEASADSIDSDSSGSPPVKIVPKGLRSFDAHDADFFLELLPGPRDREGLPDSLRFWKTRIEETDSDNTFSVGLIYGPSGCGKSSLVKAGLLPRLSEDVIPVYVESTPEETEGRLLHGLQKRCRTVEENLDLKETLAALRRGKGIPSEKKVLIILDQFEQWLHATKEEENSELVQALRQCDGGRVQCIVMVRDDFWMAVTRFLRDLEVRLLEDHNFAAVDLFPERHAAKVLAAFGRAFGALPDESSKTSKEQKEFLKQSVSGLAEEGKVICVRLALFVDMMKGKPWTPSTLKEVGGTKGIGSTFLEETFSSSTASPEHRYHQKAAHAVLKALLPESGTDIKGEMTSYDELLEASGYARHPKDFDDLIHILDSEIRLITPTDPEGMESEDDSVSQAELGQKYYQLTHDYLVHSLRDWLTRKQKETRRGRAELRLAEHVSLWNAKPDKSRLPSLFGYLNMRLYTDKSKWSGPQRKLMRKAGRMHGVRWGSVLLILVVTAITVQQITSSVQRRNTLQRTQTAVAAMSNSRGILVPHAIEDLKEFPRQMVVEELQARFADSDKGQKLPLAYALAHFKSVKVDFLVEQIRHAPSDEVDNLVAALVRSKEDSLKSMRAAAKRADSEADWRYKARLAIVALRLGNTTFAEDICRDRPDPIQRTIFIETLAKWHGDLTELAAQAEGIKNGPLRYGIGQGVGSIPTDQLTASFKQAWQSVLSDWYQNKPDVETHSATDWALRQWNLELPQVAPSKEPAEGMDRHINSAGTTMLKIPAGTFERGKPQVTLTRSFLLASREVSVGQFQRFMDDPDYPAEEQPQDWPGEVEAYSPTAEHPVNNVNWYDAVMFCNWLSRREGLRPCYERTGAKEHYENYKGEIKILGDAWQLVDDANGYRLPTEAEWEYACRAGSVTTYCYGDDESLLDRYAVYRASRTQPCSSKLPNGWGLFDMHGNLREWCQDWYDSSYDDEPEVSNPMGPEKGSQRVLRGGSFLNNARAVRSALRSYTRPDYRYINNGFRVARTYP